MMAQTFMVRILPPMAVNQKKRLVKAPKVYIRDSGILHTLLEIEDMENLFGHPNVGVSWEGWCIEQILKIMPGWRPGFYRTSSGFDQSVDANPEIIRVSYITFIIALRKWPLVLLSPLNKEFGNGFHRNIHTRDIVSIE